MVAAGAHRPGPLKQQNKAHKGGKHSGSSQRRAGGEAGRGRLASLLALPAAALPAAAPPDRFFPTGRVSVKAQPRRRLRDLSRVDRRHQALQLRRQRKEAVRPAREAERGGAGRVVWGAGSGSVGVAARGRYGSRCGGGCLGRPIRFGSLWGDPKLGQREDLAAWVSLERCRSEWVRVELWRDLGLSGRARGGATLQPGLTLCGCVHRCWQRSGAWAARTGPRTSWCWCRCTVGLWPTTPSACCRARTQQLSAWMRGELVALCSSAPNSSSAGAL